MNKPAIETSETERTIIKGFEGEDIPVNIEQLEVRLVPESLAGFLD